MKILCTTWIKLQSISRLLKCNYFQPPWALRLHSDFIHSWLTFWSIFIHSCLNKKNQKITYVLKKLKSFGDFFVKRPCLMEVVSWHTLLYVPWSICMVLLRGSADTVHPLINSFVFHAPHSLWCRRRVVCTRRSRLQFSQKKESRLLSSIGAGGGLNGSKLFAYISFPHL